MGLGGRQVLAAAGAGGEVHRGRAGSAAADREIDRLRKAADPAGTVWSRYNLSETLPKPLPMTWSLMRLVLHQRRRRRGAAADDGVHARPAGRQAARSTRCGRCSTTSRREAQTYFDGYRLPTTSPR